MLSLQGLYSVSVKGAKCLFQEIKSGFGNQQAEKQKESFSFSHDTIFMHDSTRNEPKEAMEEK
jgi:hypothetical protein